MEGVVYGKDSTSVREETGSSRSNPGDRFLRIFIVAFLIFLAHVRIFNPAGLSLILN